jgi:hypothetical protein
MDTLIIASLPIIKYLHSIRCIIRVGVAQSIVTDYTLDDWGSIPSRGKGFSSSLCVQTSSEAHTASCPMGTGGPFPGVKRGRGATLTTHPHVVLRLRMSRSYASSPPPPSPCMAVAGYSMYERADTVYSTWILPQDTLLSRAVLFPTVRLRKYFESHTPAVPRTTKDVLVTPFLRLKVTWES